MVPGPLGFDMGLLRVHEGPSLIKLQEMQLEAPHLVVKEVAALVAGLHHELHDCVMNTKSRRGRPPKSSGTAKSKSVLLRLEPKEKAAFEEAASIAGVPLAVWFRERLRWAAIKELESADRILESI